MVLSAHISARGNRGMTDREPVRGHGVIHETETQVPGTAPEYTERVDDYSDTESGLSLRRRGFILVGAFAAGAAIVGGIALGPKLFGNHNQQPTKEAGQPVATAPVTPGEHQSPTSSETAPAYNPGDPSTWTVEHVPLEIKSGDGINKYNSVAELEAVFSLPVANYPDLATNPSTFATDLLGRINTYTASINSRQVDHDLSTYTTPTALAAGGYEGAPLVLDNFITPALSDALVGTPENGAGTLGTDNTADWLKSLNAYAHTNSQRGARTNMQYNIAYSLDPSVTPEATTTGSNPAAGSYHVAMYVTIGDNFDQTNLGSQPNANGGTLQPVSERQVWNMEVQKQKGTNGQEVFKIISISADTNSTS